MVGGCAVAEGGKAPPHCSNIQSLEQVFEQCPQ
jgi:hypothetical protein